MTLTRRHLLGTVGATVFAPAVLAGWKNPPGLTFTGFDQTGSAYQRYLGVWARYRDGKDVAGKEATALLEFPESFTERRDVHPDASPFGIFTSCTPHRDVFYDCLDYSLRWLTALDNPDPSLPPIYNRGQLYSWQWSFWGRAALELYEATGERRFLDLLLGACVNVMAARDDRHGIVDENQKRVVKSWGSVISFGGPPMRGTDITATGLIALPILRLANHLAAHGETNDAIAEFAREIEPSFDEYETFYLDLPTFDAGCYRYAFIPQAVDPTNHINAFAAGLVELHAFTKDPRHLEKARKLMNFYRRSMVIDDDGAISTPYMQDPEFKKHPKSEWFWKMTVSAELPLALARYGLVVKEEEMIGIARTYADVVMADPDRINCMTRRSDTERMIDFTKPLDSETPEYRSYVPMIAAGLFFVDRERRIGEKLLAAMLRYPQWFSNGLFSGGCVATLARAYSLRRGLRL